MSGTTPVLEALLQRCDHSIALCQHDNDKEVLSWSFRQLQEAQHYCSAVLRGAGLRQGDRVLLLCSDVPQFFAVFFAALDLDLCLLPLHPDQDQRCLQDIVQTQRPALALVDTAASPLLSLVRGLIPQCIALEPGAPDWLRPLHALPSAVAAAASASSAPAPDSAAVATDRTAVATAGTLVFHSSGSTGLPKALYYSRMQLDTFLQWQQRLFAPFDDEAQDHGAAVPTPRINVLPLTHWGGLSFCLQALSEGRAVHLFNVFYVSPLLQLIERSGCRLLMLVPAMYREMLLQLEQRCPPSLRYCLTMGEAMPSALAAALRRRHGLLLCTAYGMSEALSGMAHGAVPLDEVPHGSCGQRAFGEMKLVGNDGRPQAESGEAEGELWVRNGTTVPCYRDAALLQAKYVDGWYRTGDCFRRDAAGHYYFQSRLDAMCVHNGRNIYPQQVESVFIEHPAVAACVAAPLRMPDGRRRIGVYLVLTPGHELSSHELLDYYLLHGAHYAAPVFMLLADSMPATWSGKPERAGITELLQAAHDHACAEAGLLPGKPARRNVH
jgi:acyl-CoA synthetase (AMP-forming)/AMP-acid ligase II